MNEGIVVEVKTPTTEIEMRIFLAQGDNVEESGIWHSYHLWLVG